MIETLVHIGILIVFLSIFFWVAVTVCYFWAWSGDDRPRCTCCTRCGREPLLTLEDIQDGNTHFRCCGTWQPFFPTHK